MPTFAVTNTTGHSGFIDALVRREVKRRIVEPFERATITVDEVLAHSKYVTVEEQKERD